MRFSGRRYLEDASPADRPTAGSHTIFTGTEGDDRIAGTDGKDEFRVGQGGDDTLRGLGGNDVFYFGGTLTETDRVNGGAGRDTVLLTGDYSDGLLLSPEKLTGIERFNTAGGFSYQLTVVDGFEDFRINCRTSDDLILDGSHLTTGSIDVFGSAGEDIIIAGAGDDHITGQFGADTLAGGAGNDRFIYLSELQSTTEFGYRPDLITDFAEGDRVALPTDRVSAFHIGATAGHIGDVVASYDTSANQTTLDIFTDADAVADMTILLTGDHVALRIIHDTQIVLAG